MTVETVNLLGYEFVRTSTLDRGPWEFFLMKEESEKRLPRQLELSLSRLATGEENPYAWHCNIKIFSQNQGAVRASSLELLGEELHYELNAISVSYLTLCASLEKSFPAKENSIRKSIIARIKESI